MPFTKSVDFGSSTLAGSLPASGEGSTTLVMNTEDGEIFDNAGQYYCYIWGNEYDSPEQDADHELVLIEKSANDTFTVTRAQGGTLASAWSLGDKIANCLCQLKIEELEQATTSSGEGHPHNQSLNTSDLAQFATLLVNPPEAGYAEGFRQVIYGTDEIPKGLYIKAAGISNVALVIPADGGLAVIGSDAVDNSFRLTIRGGSQLFSGIVVDTSKPNGYGIFSTAKASGSSALLGCCSSDIPNDSIGYGIRGICNTNSSTAYAGHFYADGDGSNGVLGQSLTGKAGQFNTTTGYAGHFTSNAEGIGLYVSSVSGYAMLIYSGKVGIGTLTPTGAKVQIIALTAEALESGLYVKNLATEAARFGIKGECSTSTTAAGLYGLSSSGYGVKGISTNGIAGYFDSSSGYGLIVAAGNVGIGTNTPDAARIVIATSTSPAIDATTSGSGGTTGAIIGRGTGGTAAAGVVGTSSHATGIGVRAENTGNGIGLYVTNGSKLHGGIIVQTGGLEILQCGIKLEEDTDYEGAIWYDSTMHVLKYYNGTDIKTIATV